MGITKNIPIELTISKVIAKLHLAGKTQVVSKNTGIVNTGIKKDNNNKPENPGDIDFDLGSKDGTYEVGIVKNITYKVNQEEILKASAEKAKKEIGIDSEVAEIAKINSEMNLKDEDIKKIKELETSLSASGIADDEVQKINDELSKLKPDGYEDKIKKKEEIQKSARDKLDKYYKDTIGKDPKDLGDVNQDPNIVFQKVLQAYQEKNGASDVESQIKDIRQKEIDNAATEALSDIEKYMGPFAGEKYGKPKKPTAKDLPYVNVPENFSGVSKDVDTYVKDFKIEGLSQDQVNKDIEEQKKKDPNQLSETLCFKVQYIMTSEK